MSKELTEREIFELTGLGDSQMHYHLADRGPFPIAYGSFHDTTTQTIASTTTAYVITVNTTDASGGVSLSGGSKVVASTRGTYNIQFSLQLANSAVTDRDAEIWIRKNGTDVPASNTIVSVPSSHGGTDGHAVAAWNFFVALNRGDYIQLVWRADSTSVSIPAFAAGVTPTRPSTPSVILTANLVSV